MGVQNEAEDLLLRASDQIHVLLPVQFIRSPVPELGEGKSGPRERKFAKTVCCAKESEYMQIRSYSLVSICTKFDLKCLDNTCFAANSSSRPSPITT